MEQMEEGGCIFYDNRKKRNLAADHKLCDALRLQVAYLFRRHHVIDFLVLDSSDSDIVFSSIVDEYRKSIRRSTKISCTIYFKNFCGNLHNYHTNFNCMARYDDILKAVDCVVRQSTRLLLLDDGTLQKPYIYELADSMKIPIYIVDPTRQTFRVKHQAGYSDSLKQAFLNVRALRAIVPHNLKKRLAALKGGLTGVNDQIHHWEMVEILQGREPGRGVLFKRLFQATAVKLKQEIRVVSALLEYGDKRLNALYWKAKEADEEAREIFYVESSEVFTYPYYGNPGLSPEITGIILEADKTVLRFRRAFNKKSAARGGFTIKGTLFIIR